MKDGLLSSAAIIGARVLDDDQRACVDALEQALEQAREGNVSGLAIVLCMPGGWATAIAGNRPGDLNLGCDDLKNKILDAVLNAAKNKAMGRIIKARM